MKRLKSWRFPYLAVLLCLAIFFLMAQQAQAYKSKIYKSGDYKYTVKDGVVKIMRYTGTDKTVTVPEKISSYKVEIIE